MDSRGVKKTVCSVIQDTNRAAVVERAEKPDVAAVVEEPEKDSMAAAMTDSEEASTAAGMDETNWSKLWFDTLMLVNNLDLFFDDFYDADDLVENRIPKEDLQKHYDNAVAVAAALERMLNGKKYTT